MPAISLRCRICETEHELGPFAVCPRDFGPLDPVYDWDALRRRGHARVDRGRAAVDLALRAAAARRRRPPSRASRPGFTPLVAAPRLASALGLARALPEARHGEPDALVQGPRRRGRAARRRRSSASTRSPAPRPATSRTPSPPGRRPRGWRRRSSARPTSSPRSSSRRRCTARRSTRFAAPTTIAAASPSSSPSSCPGASSTSACARTTPRARRRSRYEIAEQLGWELPDVVVAPIASGAMYSKVGQGFAELARARARRGTAAAHVRRPGRRLRARRGRARRGPARDAGPARTPIARSLAIGNPADGELAVGDGQGDTNGDIHVTAEDEIGINMALLAETTGRLRRDGGRRHARGAARGGSPRADRRGRSRRPPRHRRRPRRRRTRSPSASRPSRSTPTRTRCSSASASPRASGGTGRTGPAPTTTTSGAPL